MRRLPECARVYKVLIDNGHVVGVEGKIGGVKFTAGAETVVLAAGGIGSPRLLQNSGMTAAGVGMTMDATTMVYGVTHEKGTGREPPMSWSWENPDVGYMLSTLTDPCCCFPWQPHAKGLAPLFAGFNGTG